ncbi:MAG: hypothetical protein QNI99_09325 [Woeseiaceae bacterium]|nr:hypothetical protein [Woeseiaceae bacterium]
MDTRDRELLIEIRDDVRLIRERTDKLFEMIENEVTPEDLEEIGLKHHPIKLQMKKTLGELAGFAIIALIGIGIFLLARALGWIQA